MVTTLRSLVVLTSIGAGLASSAAPGGNRLAPIAAVDAVSTHAPFEMGACVACHQESKAPSSSPGPVSKAGSNDLCFDCHEEYRAPVRRHPAAKGACVACHSPHNARKRKLLLGS